MRGAVIRTENAAPQIVQPCKNTKPARFFLFYGGGYHLATGGPIAKACIAAAAALLAFIRKALIPGCGQKTSPAAHAAGLIKIGV